MNRLEPGNEFETTIVAITNDCIFLDMNTKSEGILDKAEISDENGNVSVKEGDKIKVYYLGYINGENRFTTKISGDKADKSLLENAFKNGIPIEGRVEKEIKGGFEIKFGETRAFCPYSQMGYQQKEEASFYIGKNMMFCIQEFKENGRNILVSNRIIGEMAHNETIADLQKKLSEGMTINATVKSLQKFGAFVDIGGVQALLPISEISMERIDNAQSILKVGQEITVKILKIDWQTNRISVSLKALLKNPWDSAKEDFLAGTKITGKISRIAEFGLFVELKPGIDGLVHISTISDVDRNTNLRKKFKIGEKLDVVVNEVDEKEHRISLKPATSSQQDIDTASYMASQKNNDDSETYNPFAALLKRK